MTPDLVTIASPPHTSAESASVTAALQVIEERTRAVAEVTDGLRPLLELAQHAPAFVAIVMDSLDDAVRTASSQGIDVERGLINGAEAALRFGATMDADKVRDLDALLKSGVLAPGALRIIGELGRALTETAAAPRATTGVVGLLKALGQPDVQRALGFLVTFAERFGQRLRELTPRQD